MRILHAGNGNTKLLGGEKNLGVGGWEMTMEKGGG